MKIWFEALTGKQALLFHYLSEYFESKNIKTFFTVRDYDYVIGNLQMFNRINYYAVGKYGGASLYNKLIVGSERIIDLAKIIQNEKPDILISFSSPDATRVAFGMAIPIIQLNDTPHAKAAAKLTFSLSNVVIHPEAINPLDFRNLGARELISYRGVDEVLWTKNFKPNLTTLENLNLKKYKYIVVRCEESKAAYFQEMYPEIPAGSTIIPELVKNLKDNGFDYPIIAFPRYPEQVDVLKKIDEAIIPDNSIDTLTLLHYAKLAMTGGGTMGREGALLGTPTIYSFPKELDVSTYVTNLGFPLFHVPDHSKLVSSILTLMNEPRMDEARRVEYLNKLETPLDGVLKAMKMVLKNV
jgi:uncharacterized protein